MESGGERALQARAAKAFAEYRKKALHMAKRTKISEKEKIELERARKELDAVMKAKATVEKKKSVAKIEVLLKTESRDDGQGGKIPGGVDAVQRHTEQALENLDTASRK